MYPEVTHEQRTRLKAAINTVLRARIAQAHYERCRGCGRDTDQVGVTIGCKQCADRRLRRARLQDPVVRARENQARRWMGRPPR